MQPVERLRRRPDFLRVAGARHKWAMPGLVLQARRRSGFGRPATTTEPSEPAVREPGSAIRVGFTASRKIGGAVERNRARRRLRAVAGAVLPEQARPGYDFVLIARAGTLHRRYEDLVEDLRTALVKLGAARDGKDTEDDQ
jgi:ribonuclease P protein component